MNFDINRMKRSDQIIAVCGALLFISLFLPFFHVGDSTFSVSAKGHQSGFLAWAGLWIGFLAGGLGFFPALGVQWPGQLPVTKTITTLGVSGLATLLLVLRFLFKPGGSGTTIGTIHIGVSRSFGIYFALVVVIVQVVFAVLAFRESGEAFPTKANFQGTGSSGSAPGHTPPEQPGYQAPPPADWQNPQPPADA